MNIVALQVEPELQDFIMLCEVIDYLHMVLFQIIPAELIDIAFIKPKHSKSLEHQDDTSVLSAKKIKVIIGSQDFPNIKAETLHNSIYKSVPNSNHSQLILMMKL